MSELNKIVFSKDAIEFVTVCVQYCAFIEHLNDMESAEFCDKMTKILPLLYLKATLLPETDSVNDENPEIAVTEDDYNFVISSISSVLGGEDTYLEVFMQDMKYSETPIAANISEDLADIYQDLKNFIFIYEQGIVDNMNDALYICNENFKNYWGQKLVNVLRALHALRYTNESYNLDEEISEDEW